jgi:hypothetical protein
VFGVPAAPAVKLALSFFALHPTHLDVTSAVVMFVGALARYGTGRSPRASPAAVSPAERPTTRLANHHEVLGRPPYELHKWAAAVMAQYALCETSTYLQAYGCRLVAGIARDRTCAAVQQRIGGTTHG